MGLAISYGSIIVGANIRKSKKQELINYHWENEVPKSCYFQQFLTFIHYNGLLNAILLLHNMAFSWNKKMCCSRIFCTYLRQIWSSVEPVWLWGDGQFVASTWFRKIEKINIAINTIFTNSIFKYKLPNENSCKYINL